MNANRLTKIVLALHSTTPLIEDCISIVMEFLIEKDKFVYRVKMEETVYRHSTFVHVDLYFDDIESAKACLYKIAPDIPKTFRLESYLSYAWDLGSRNSLLYECIRMNN